MDAGWSPSDESARWEESRSFAIRSATGRQLEQRRSPAVLVTGSGRGAANTMTVTKYDIRVGTYYDSLVLMQLQRGLLGLNGVVDAGVIMATQANRELLASNNLLPSSISTNPDDLLIVVKADTEESAMQALNQVDELLARKRSSVSQDFRPRSLSGAVKQLPEANWVLISVPGRYAAGVAREALELGKHVFLYSDNVSSKM